MNTRRILLSNVLVGSILAMGSVLITPNMASAQQPDPLSATRLLRRIKLTLLDSEPTFEEYEELLARPEAEQVDFARSRVDVYLADDRFEQVLWRWARDYLGTGAYASGENFAINLAIELSYCKEGTVNAGALTWVWHEESGDRVQWCDDPDVTRRVMAPWWDPGSPVTVLGSIGDETTQVMQPDGSITSCAIPGDNTLYNVFAKESECSCGPALIYCRNPDIDQGEPSLPYTQRRGAFEEPHRLFAHIIQEGRPFSDLVLGDYTVVNRNLYHMYLRATQINLARDPSRRALGQLRDMDRWWERFDGLEDWHEVKFSELDPYWLDERDYTFDPRLQVGEPEGLPSAGVLSTLVAQRTHERERVRAARWLEQLTCKKFSPPDVNVTFNTFERDPATEGTCQHCHRVIDPAAIHFKRPFAIFGGNNRRGLYGIGAYKLDERSTGRIIASFIPDTMLTPISEEDRMRDMNTILLDFLPPDQTLLGERSDGTIGPLGFGKLIVQSGEFDRCAVQRAYARFGGQALDRGEDQAMIEELTKRFVEHDRDMKGLIQYIVTMPVSEQGL